MNIDWKTFRKDPYFFFKYFFAHMVVLLGVFAWVYHVRHPFSETISFQAFHFALIPLAILAGVQVPALLHNAVHFNIKPRWLNEVLGEVCGFFVLFGLGPFRISHFLHHAFADTKFDPHPPEGHSFFHFLTTTQLNTIVVIARKYIDLHGNTKKSWAILVSEMGFYYVGLVTRLLLWFWILGPTLFIVTFVPAYVTNVLIFAHINFATHKTLADGTVEIVNLNETLYHKTVNLLGSGVYFHRNHHKYPHLYNPAKLKKISV